MGDNSALPYGEAGRRVCALFLEIADGNEEREVERLRIDWPTCLLNHPGYEGPIACFPQRV